MRSLLLPLVAASVTIALFLPFAAIGVDPHHDGIVLKSALDVLSGRSVFKDTFSQYGLLAPELQAASLWLFGRTLYSLKLLNVLAYGVTSAFLVSTWRRLLPLSLTAVAFAMWILFAPFYDPTSEMHAWPSVIALACQSGALYFLACGIENRRASRFFAAGISTGLTCLARTPVGALSAVGISLGILAVGYGEFGKRPGVGHSPSRDHAPDRAPLAPDAALRAARAWGVFLLGTGLVLAAFFAHLLFIGALGDWYRQTLAWPAAWAHGANAGEPAGRRMLHFLFLYNVAFIEAPRAPAFQWIGLLALMGGVALPAVFVRARRAGREPGESEFGRKRGDAPAPRVGALPAYGALCVAEAVCVLVAWACYPALVFRVHGLATLIPVTLAVAATLSVAARFIPRDQASNGRADARETGTDDNAIFIALAFPMVASWAQYYPGNDPRHIYWAVAPMIGGFAYLAYRWAKREAAAVACAFAVILAPLGWSAASNIRGRMSLEEIAIRGVPILAGMRESPGDARKFEEDYARFQAYHGTHPGFPMVLEGGDALWLTFADDTANFAPMFVHWANFPKAAWDLGARDRFIRERHPLILVQPPFEKVAEDLRARFGYEAVFSLAREPSVAFGPR